MFFPFYLVLSSALNLNIEHKSHSWKKLLLLPTSRTSIFLNKGLFLAIQTGFAMLLFFIAMLLFGSILGIIHSELKLFDYLPNFTTSLSFLGRLFIASLGILSIQYTLSLFIKNTIIPMTLGIILVITALIITKNWEYSVYFPYSFTSVLFYVNEGKMNVAMWGGLTISEWLSIAVSIFVMLIGTWLFQRKEIK